MRPLTAFLLASLALAHVTGCGSASRGAGSGGKTGTGTGGNAGSPGATGGAAGQSAEQDAGATDASPHGGAGGNGGPCWTTPDCPPHGTCVAPGQILCGGICSTFGQSCSTDLDCANVDAGPAAGPSICDYVPCSCSTGNMCHPGCAGDADCATGAACGTDHRCAPLACAPGTGSCPVDFTCGADQHCVRKTCASDAECSQACVEGACYDHPGRCQGPTA